MNDSSKLKDGALIDFKDKNLDNFRYFKVNACTAVRGHLAPKTNVDENVESEIVKKIIFNICSASTIPQTTPNSEPTGDIHAVSKSFVDSSSQNNRKKRDLSTVFDDQDNEFDNNKITNLDKITFKRNPTTDNEVSNKKFLIMN